MIHKLDMKDKRILHELDKNSRASASEIAKRVKLSKETCIYRINNLVKNGIISNFTTLVGLGNLGLFSHKLYIQLHGLSNEKKKQMIEFFKKNEKINWIAECVGDYDLIIAILCTDIKEFNQEKNKILEKYSRYVQNYTIGIMAETRIYERGYLIEKSEDKESFLIGKLNPLNLSDNDKELLSLLTQNSRITAVELAEKIKLNVKTIVSKIKMLEKENIIQGYKIGINLEKIGFKFYKAFIHINKFNKLDLDRFLDFCKLNRNIIHLVENVGNWEFEPEFEIESDDEFYKLITELKTKFPDFIKKIDIVNIAQEHKFIYSLIDFKK